MDIQRYTDRLLPASLPLFILAALTSYLSGCAQSKLIGRSHAFYVQRQPGTVRVDPSTGEEVPRKTDTLVTVYVETTKNDITWDTAWRNGRAYMIRAILVGQTQAEAGTSKDSSRKIVITPSANNFLWQLQLFPMPGDRTRPVQQGILIRAAYNGAVMWHQAREPVELEPVPSV